jgi:primary-amine oxidase
VSAHPLDPLSADEIRQAAGALRRDHGVGERWRFASIELREPPKRESISRQAEVICFSRDDGKVYKARVDLDADRVLAWDHQPDGQPNMTVDEFHECDQVLRSDPRVIEALAARGI